MSKKKETKEEQPELVEHSAINKKDKNVFKRHEGKIVCKFGGFCYIQKKGKKIFCSKCKVKFSQIKGKGSV